MKKAKTIKPVRPVRPVKPVKPVKPKKVLYSATDDLADKIAQVMIDVEAELHRATSQHGPMNSIHEGYSVILEEVDELWDQVRLKSSLRNQENIREECIQIAAMAARLVVDLL